MNCCHENLYNVVCQYQCQRNGEICNTKDVTKIKWTDPTGGATIATVNVLSVFIIFVKYFII